MNAQGTRVGKLPVTAGSVSPEMLMIFLVWIL